VIADITCDINGSIPSTKRASSIADPLYDYDPVSDDVFAPMSNDRYITVMAIDNLPCELPRSASEEFGRDLIDKILKPLLVEDPEGIIARGTIADRGKLGSHFQYLSDYAAD
jgi:saccharopine dehydrogenase (NAD+, L-lysine-forming)